MADLWRPIDLRVNLGGMHAQAREVREVGLDACAYHGSPVGGEG